MIERRGGKRLLCVVYWDVVKHDRKCGRSAVNGVHIIR